MGFFWGMMAYGISFSWFLGLFHAAATGLWALLSLYIACFAWLQGMAWEKGVRGRRWLGFTVMNWMGWEFLRCEVLPLNFPWMTPAVALGPNVLLPWIGVYGVSALMVLAAAVVVNRPTMGGKALAAAAGILGFAALGWPRTPMVPDAGQAVKVGLVQNENVTMDEYAAQTAKLPGDIELIVWPEYALPYDVRANRKDLATLQKICRDRKASLVLGTETAIKGSKDRFNTALALHGGGVWGEHSKIHTVHLFDDGTPGTLAMPVKLPLGFVGTPVCFDCDYEDVVRRMTAAGAEFFAVPSMDAVSWSEREHRQHAVLFQIRACENGRWFAVCASSGVSQIIDPHGMIVGSLGPLVVGELVRTVGRKNELTFFTRIGWLLPWIMLGTASFCWLAILLSRGRRR